MNRLPRVRQALFLLLALAAATLPPLARAACTLSFTALNFSGYAGAAITGVNQATVNCPSGTQYTLSLNAGTGSGATTTIRKMTSSSGVTLNYQIFQNSARTTNWGNTSGTDTVSGTGTGSNQTVTAYSQIPAGQQVAPGTYTDTISSSTQSFTVTATLQSNCTLSATALAFGNYTGAVLNGTSTKTTNCTRTTSYTIGLSAGTSSGATVTNRLLTGPGGGQMSYTLFSDSNRTLNWGSTSNTVAGTGTGAAQIHTVYGQIRAGQYMNPGNYTDTITATVTY